MISITSVTRNYILQPELIRKHKKTLQWLSSVMMWKSELAFFQNTLEESVLFMQVKNKKRVGHFQNLFLYYSGEVIDDLRSKLRKHENRLASVLKAKNETGTQYFLEHASLMDELETFLKSYNELKRDFLKFISKKK